MPDAFFHDDSECVRFWVSVEGVPVGASVSRSALHHSYAPRSQGEDPMATYRAHVDGLEAAVRRRVAKGSIEPVMIREFDLRPEAGATPAR